ncbi:hypothetical protein ABTK26_20765, partial [Acinetobacter baumannii]
VRKALHVTATTRGKVAMLLNLASLAHASRTEFWRTTRPRRIWIVDSVTCWPEPEREPPRHFRENRYCWVIWEGAHDRPTQID